MGDNCKYIVVEKNGDEVPIVFSADQDHSYIAKLIGGKVLSAGFVNFRGTVRTTGKSASLNIGPAEGDDQLLKIYLDVSAD